MPKIEIVPEIPANYKKMEFLGGANGTCYLTADGDVYKHFKYPYKYEYELGVLSDQESSTCAFPTRIVYKGTVDSKVLDGYRMRLEQGKRWEKLDPNTPIDAIVNASRIVESEALRLAKESGIVLDNTNTRNVVFRRNNTFGIYDTDYFLVNPNDDEYENVKQTLREWNNYILSNINCYVYMFNSDKLNLYTELASLSGKIKASEVMEELLIEMRVQGRIDPVTLEQFNEGMRLIRRP